MSTYLQLANRIVAEIEAQTDPFSDPDHGPQQKAATLETMKALARALLAEFANGNSIPMSGYGTGDNTGWSVIGRARFTDDEYVHDDETVELVVECEASADAVPGEVALYDVTGGQSTQVGTTQSVTSNEPTEVTIAIPASASPATDRILELRARVDGGAVNDRCIVWSSYISIRQV